MAAQLGTGGAAPVVGGRVVVPASVVKMYAPVISSSAGGSASPPAATKTPGAAPTSVQVGTATYTGTARPLGPTGPTAQELGYQLSTQSAQMLPGVTSRVEGTSPRPATEYESQTQAAIKELKAVGYTPIVDSKGQLAGWRDSFGQLMTPEESVRQEWKRFTGEEIKAGEFIRPKPIKEGEVTLPEWREQGRQLQESMRQEQLQNLSKEGLKPIIVDDQLVGVETQPKIFFGLIPVPGEKMPLEVYQRISQEKTLGKLMPQETFRPGLQGEATNPFVTVPFISGKATATGIQSVRVGIGEFGGEVVRGIGQALGSVGRTIYTGSVSGINTIAGLGSGLTAKGKELPIQTTMDLNKNIYFKSGGGLARNIVPVLNLIPMKKEWRASYSDLGTSLEVGATAALFATRAGPYILGGFGAKGLAGDIGKINQFIKGPKTTTSYGELGRTVGKTAFDVAGIYYGAKGIKQQLTKPRFEGYRKEYPTLGNKEYTAITGRPPPNVQQAGYTRNIVTDIKYVEKGAERNIYLSGYSERPQIYYKYSTPLSRARSFLTSGVQPSIREVQIFKGAQDIFALKTTPTELFQAEYRFQKYGPYSTKQMFGESAGISKTISLPKTFEEYQALPKMQRLVFERQAEAITGLPMNAKSTFATLKKEGYQFSEFTFNKGKTLVPPIPFRLKSVSSKNMFFEAGRLTEKDLTYSYGLGRSKILQAGKGPEIVQIDAAIKSTKSLFPRMTGKVPIYGGTPTVKYINIPEAPMGPRRFYSIEGIGFDPDKLRRINLDIEKSLTQLPPPNRIRFSKLAEVEKTDVMIGLGIMTGIFERNQTKTISQPIEITRVLELEKAITREVQRPQERIIQRSGQLPQERILTRQPQTVIEIPQLVEKIQQKVIVPTPERPFPPYDLKLVKPTRPKSSVSGPIMKRKLKGKVKFQAELRRRGKFFAIGPQVAKPEEAFAIGKKAVTTTLGASTRVKIVGTGKYVSPEKFTSIGTPVFRLSKVSPNIVVQRRRQRLITRPEVKEIISTRLAAVAARGGRLRRNIKW